MSANGLRKFNHHPSGMKESFLGDYYYDTEVDEFIRTQQATIERLTEQRDRLLKSGNMVLRGHSSFDTSYMAYCIRDLQSLIAEIESSK